MKRLLVLFFVSCIFLLATGCTININVSPSANDTKNETISKNSDTSSHISGYQSRSTIYISNKGSTELPAISSSDLVASKSLIETYAVILNTSQIQSKIREEYPDLKYELTLEQINETEVFAIIATSENPEKLEAVCNLAVSLFCEEIPLIIDGASCKVVDRARPAQRVGAN